IDYSQKANWMSQIEKIVKYYYNNATEDFMQNINTLLQYITEATIDTGSEIFALKDVNTWSRLQELEFNFMVPKFRLDELSQLATEDVAIRTNSVFQYELEGIFNGFIDLVFEHKGKYYILDWKSNY